MIESRMLRWVRHVERKGMKMKINVYKDFVRKPEEMRPRGRPRR
jgi:hypothetical protein